MRNEPGSPSEDEIKQALFPLHRELDEFLAGFLTDQGAAWTAVRPELAEGFELLAGFVARGGKRLRPALFYWGAMAAEGPIDHDLLLRGAAAVEVLHSFALIHDDVMDASDTRRGHPALHRQLEHRHATQRQAGDSARYGQALAVLIGDVALVLADMLMEGNERGVLEFWNELRLELAMGQWLDIVTTADQVLEPALSRAIAVFKSGEYSVRRPLLLGFMAAGGTDRERMAVLSTFGKAVGEAFQLNDDLLGAFGAPEATGKPARDIEEGKPTWMAAVASRRLETADEQRLMARYGASDLSPEEVDGIREILRLRARPAVEERIVELARLGKEALATGMLPAATQGALEHLAALLAPTA